MSKISTLRTFGKAATVAGVLLGIIVMTIQSENVSIAGNLAGLTIPLFPFILCSVTGVIINLIVSKMADNLEHGPTYSSIGIPSSVLEMLAPVCVLMGAVIGFASCTNATTRGYQSPPVWIALLWIGLGIGARAIVNKARDNAVHRERSEADRRKKEAEDAIEAEEARKKHEAAIEPLSMHYNKAIISISKAQELISEILPELSVETARTKLHNTNMIVDKANSSIADARNALRDLLDSYPDKQSHKENIESANDSINSLHNSITDMLKSLDAREFHETFSSGNAMAQFQLGRKYWEDRDFSNAIQLFVQAAIRDRKRVTDFLVERHNELSNKLKILDKERADEEDGIRLHNAWKSTMNDVLGSSSGSTRANIEEQMRLINERERRAAAAKCISEELNAISDFHSSTS